jgi:hypothetical protein
VSLAPGEASEAAGVDGSHVALDFIDRLVDAPLGPPEG